MTQIYLRTPTPSSLSSMNEKFEAFETLVNRRQADRAKRQIGISLYLPHPTLKNLLSPINSGVSQVARRLVFALLSQLKHGQLTVVETFGKNERKTFGVTHPKNDCQKSNEVTGRKLTDGEKVGNHHLTTTLTIHSPQVYQNLLTGGSIAFANNYIDGLWQADYLTGFLRLIARNLTVINTIEAKFANINKRFEHKLHRERHNDKANAKSNILAHYDLGNAMYELFLDKRMMYSSAIYPTATASLAEAQTHKLANTTNWSVSR